MFCFIVLFVFLLVSYKKAVINALRYNCKQQLDIATQPKPCFRNGLDESIMNQSQLMRLLVDEIHV